MKIFNFFKKKKPTKRKVQKSTNYPTSNSFDEDDYIYRRDFKNNTVLDNWYLYENNNNDCNIHNDYNDCDCNDYNHNDYDCHNNDNYDYYDSSSYDDYNNYDDYSSYDSYDDHDSFDNYDY